MDVSKVNTNAGSKDKPNTDIVIWTTKESGDFEQRNNNTCEVETDHGDKNTIEFGEEDQSERTHTFTHIQKTRSQEENEDDHLEMNIQSAGKARHLSPRQIADLKGGCRRIRIGQSIISL